MTIYEIDKQCNNCTCWMPDGVVRDSVKEAIKSIILDYEYGYKVMAKKHAQALTQARKEGAEAEIKRRKPFPILADTPEDASYMLENHKDEVNCPHCKHRIYVMFPPSSYDDFKLGQSSKEFQIKTLEKKIAELTNCYCEELDSHQLPCDHCRDTRIARITELEGKLREIRADRYRDMTTNAYEVADLQAKLSSSEQDTKRWKIGYDGFANWLRNLVPIDPIFRKDHEGDLQENLAIHLHSLEAKLSEAEAEIARLKNE